uniref:E3 ubiquitin-protein ligase MARCHF7-like n=1 Tax=Solea senegalensis TaxID=28829 RepID=UPI001CD9012C|nr:E3 ubiquitin-protein ligase MARCHF7-like [Solea senegalensis]
MASTYAQGAQPTKTPSSSSSTYSATERSQNQHPLSTHSQYTSSSYSSRTPWYTTTPVRQEVARPPSICSLDNDSPINSPSSSKVGESGNGEEGASMFSVDPDARWSETSLGSLKNHRADLNNGYCSVSKMSLWGEPSVRNSNNSSGGDNGCFWLSSSFQDHLPPSCPKRHTSDGSARSTAGLEEEYSHPQHLLTQWDNVENKALQKDEVNGKEKGADAEEGAVGLDVLAAGRPWQLQDETLHGHSVIENSSVPMGQPSGVENQEKVHSKRDQENLYKIKEKLLLEDSSDEEGDLCRICHTGEKSAANSLIQPCRCTGSVQYVHKECIKRWIMSKITSRANLKAITTCELCKEKLCLDVDSFDIPELHRTHVQSESDDDEGDELISRGLHLLVLLRLFEERYSNSLGTVDAISLESIHHNLLDLLITLTEGSDGEDNSMSNEFSDLDDDLEEDW